MLKFAVSLVFVLFFIPLFAFEPDQVQLEVDAGQTVPVQTTIKNSSNQVREFSFSLKKCEQGQSLLPSIKNIPLKKIKLKPDQSRKISLWLDLPETMEELVHCGQLVASSTDETQVFEIQVKILDPYQYVKLIKNNTLFENNQVRVSAQLINSGSRALELTGVFNLSKGDQRQSSKPERFWIKPNETKNLSALFANQKADDYQVQLSLSAKNENKTYYLSPVMALPNRKVIPASKPPQKAPEQAYFFEPYEFKNGGPDQIWQEITQDFEELKNFPEASSLTKLNELLKQSDFFSLWDSKRFDWPMPESLAQRVSVTEAYRKANWESLDLMQKISLLALNRLLLESIYFKTLPLLRDKPEFRNEKYFNFELPAQKPLQLARHFKLETVQMGKKESTGQFQLRLSVISRAQQDQFLEGHFAVKQSTSNIVFQSKLPPFQLLSGKTGLWEATFADAPELKPGSYTLSIDIHSNREYWSEEKLLYISR